MSKVKLITIMHKLNGLTRTLGEPEFNGMIDKADYEIETISTSSSSQDIKSESPDKSWSNDDIRTYLNSKNIEYKTRDSKAQLLALV